MKWLTMYKWREVGMKVMPNVDKRNQTRIVGQNKEQI